MALDRILKDGTETGGTVADKINEIIDVLNGGQVATAWIRFDGEDMTVHGSKNCSVVKVTKGNFKIEFQNQMYSTAYAVVATGKRASTFKGSGIECDNFTKNDFTMRTIENEVEENMSEISVVVFGGTE